MNAFCAILADKPKKGKWWTLGIAEEDKPGYWPVKESGDPDDPLYLAPYPTRFGTKEEAKAQATELNMFYFKISEERAFEIVVSSMRAQNLSEQKKGVNQEAYDEPERDENSGSDDEQANVENPSKLMNPKQKLLNDKNM